MREPYRVVSALPTGTGLNRFLMVKAASRGDSYSARVAERFKDSPTRPRDPRARDQGRGRAAHNGRDGPARGADGLSESLGGQVVGGGDALDCLSPSATSSRAVPRAKG